MGRRGLVSRKGHEVAYKEQLYTLQLCPNGTGDWYASLRRLSDNEEQHFASLEGLVKHLLDIAKNQ